MLCKFYNKIDESVLTGIHIVSDSTIIDELESNSADNVPVQEISTLSVSSSMACSYCQVSFQSTNEQRAHYKLDWHRYNLKQSLVGLPVVPEDKFGNVADDVSSISGSESDTTEYESDEDNRSDREKTISRKIDCFRDAKIFLENNAGMAYSMYKCLLLKRRQLVTAQELQDGVINFLRAPKKKWLIVMIGGGHFAAAVFENANITVHKTFHCYTVRAKQGGSQAAKDSKGGNHPKSAGASLRRYNQLALVQHVQDIMSSWSEEIAQCSLILYRAVGPHNHSVLFGGKTPPLDKTDSRVRSIPLATRRATLKEVKRVHDMLSTLQCHGSSSELKQQMAPNAPKDVSPLHRLANEHFDSVKKKPSPVNVDRAKERPSPEREIPGLQSGEEFSDSDNFDQELHMEDLEINFSELKDTHDSLKATKWQRRRQRKKVKMGKKKYNNAVSGLQGQLVLCCQTGNIEAIQQMVEKAKEWPSRSEEIDCDDGNTEEGVAAQEPPKPVLRKEDFEECIKTPVPGDIGNTLLHVAATERFPAVVSLLLHLGCDPAIRNKKNQVAYEMSGDSATKEAFKEFVTLYPDRYNRKKSHIPEPVSEQQKKELEDKKRERKKQQKVRQKVKEKEQKEKNFEDKLKAEWLAESDTFKLQMSADILNAIKVGKSPPAPLRCFQCAVQIPSKPKPFEYNMCLFCTIACLKAHRSKTNSFGKEI